MRYFILFCLLMHEASAQSIIVSSDNSSIVVSGNSETVPKQMVRSPLRTVNEIRLEDLETRLDRLESRNKQLVVQPKTGRRYLAMFTARYCGPCQMWKRTEKRRIEQSGFRVIEYEMTETENQLKYGSADRGKRCIQNLPTFSVIDYDTGEWLSDPIVGFTSADALIPMLGGSPRLIENSPPQEIRIVNQGRFYTYRGQTYDLETFVGCGSSRCGMCNEICGAQRRYRQSLMSVPPEILLPADQQPTPHDVVREMISLMDLGPEDVLADLGCGHDARILIEAVTQSGCSGVGVEIDPVAADSSRRMVVAAGLSDQIEIITGDALDFEPEQHSVTAITAYLYPELLAKLAPKMQSVRVAASPFHEAFPEMVQHGDVWIWKK